MKKDVENEEEEILEKPNNESSDEELEDELEKIIKDDPFVYD